MITEEQIKQAKVYYKRDKLPIEEISNLTGLSTSKINTELRKAFINGEIKPRQPNKALKPATPKGQGKGKYIPTGKPRGVPPNPNAKRRQRYTGEGQGNRKTHPEKFTEDDKAEIVKDYYERGLTWGQLQAKWGIHSAQMQRLRNQYGQNYNKRAMNKGGRPKKIKTEEVTQ